jgi:hypothetical protein
VRTVSAERPYAATRYGGYGLSNFEIKARKWPENV